MKYLWYVGQWLSWLIMQPSRLVYLVEYLTEDNHKTRMVPVLVYGRVTVDEHRMEKLFFEANLILEQAHVELVPELMSDVTVDESGSFSVKNYFTSNKWQQFNNDSTMSIWILGNIEGKSGWHFPRMDHILLEESSSPSTLAHEVGHAADLWHIKDEDNVLNPSPSHRRGHVWMSKFQRAMLWSAFK